MGSRVFLLASLFSAGAGSAEVEVTPPAWAYPINPSDAAEVLHDPLHVPNSFATFSVSQIQDLNFTQDWRPSDHTTLRAFDQYKLRGVSPPAGSRPPGRGRQTWRHTVRDRQRASSSTSRGSARRRTVLHRY